MAILCRAAAKRCETKPSMLRRCNGWDSRQPCIYQITIVLADRRSNALGRLVIDNDGGLGLPPQAHDKGEAASGAAATRVVAGGAAATRVIAGDVAVGGAAGAASSVPAAAAVGDPTAVMAHVELTAAGEAVVGEWRRISEHHPEVKPLAIQVMPDHVHFILQVLRPMAKPLGNVIGGFKGGSSKAAVGRPGLWAEGFQDTILFHEGQLKAMFNYLRDNPRRLAAR